MTNFVKYITTASIICLILLPRLTLLFNGLDYQRMADLDTQPAFRLLNAARENKLSDFYAAYHIYPLLGAYTFIPTIGIYYLSEQLTGVFSSIEQFIEKYALRETRILFAIKFQMLLINLTAILISYFLAKRFTGNSKKAGLYVLLFAVLSFQTTLFSVAPRIHAFAFFATTVVLWFSCRLLENKSLKNYFLAFGASALAFSLSQTGATTFIIPVLAHFFDFENKKWQFKNFHHYFNKKLIYGTTFFILLSAILGYPKIIFSIFQLSSITKDSLFPASYVTPIFGIKNFFGFLTDFFLTTDLISGWLLGIAAFFIIFRKKVVQTLKLEAYDTIALAQILFFLVLFGSTDIMSDRFSLVIFPSLFFVSARIAIQIEKIKWAFYPLLIIMTIYFYGWLNLFLIAAGGDTREMAAKYVLATTGKNDMILSTMDKNLLGVTATPESIRRGTSGPTGLSDNLIAEKNLLSGKSRDFTLWKINSPEKSWPEFKKFKYIVLTENGQFQLLKNFLYKNDFILDKSFFSKRDEKNLDATDYIPWDMIMPRSFDLLPVKLGDFKAIGPNVFVFKNSF